MAEAHLVREARGIGPEAFEAFLGTREEPEWLRQARQEAWQILRETPKPGPDDEAWRRTDIRALSIEDLVTVMVGDGVTPPEEMRQIVERRDDLAGGLLLFDGQPALRWVDERLERRGLIFTDLLTAVREHQNQVAPYLDQVVRPGDGFFAAMNAAFWRNGIFLYVPRDLEIPLPLRAVIGLQGAPTDFSRILIVVEPGAQVTFIDERLADDAMGAAFHNGIVEIHLKENARLTYIALQNWGRYMWNFTHERASVDRDSTLDWVVVGMGAGVTKTFLEVDLVGRGATAYMSGVFFFDGQQHADYDTEQDHIAPHTKSDLLYKVALKDRARSVWQGMIRAHPGAQKTDAYQANRNLILSPHARADSIPGLEIMANDLRCTHGATVGQINEEELFYLMSRGLSRAVATRLIVEGFFAPVLDRIPVPDIRRQADAIIHRKLGVPSEEEF
ncbi:Fe-S cluster assembly protein SufD [Thermoflexus sp.]|uniref:Fe-S cluster assembly protein SufD n=1 Tax=Thermoflexus sp. TaxID=1969742 RepID=UPI002ADE35B2|nr:Fe-S cluster assembly protein SufD [Thermoflexus sp.]